MAVATANCESETWHLRGAVMASRVQAVRKRQRAVRSRRYICLVSMLSCVSSRGQRVKIIFARVPGPHTVTLQA